MVKANGITLFLRKAWAFIRRDFLIQASYRMSFFTQWIGLFISIFTLYYISKLVDARASSYLAGYGVTYFPFVLVGIAATSYIGTSMNSFSSNVTREIWSGTLEAMLATPTSLSTIIFSLALYNFIQATINVLLYLLLGCLLLKVDLSQMNILATTVVLILTVISFSSIGLMAASLVVVFKKGDPILWAFSNISWFLGGVYYPITVFPQFLQTIAHFIPVTYSLRALRLAILKGYTVGVLKQDIAALAVFCLILVPLSILVFRWAIKKAKQSGSLAFY